MINTKRDFQAERIEILEHRIRKYQSQAKGNLGIWDEQIVLCENELARARAGIFFVPRWASDQAAHNFALRCARAG